MGQRQLSSFVVDGQLFGVDVAHVQEVIRPQPLTKVPLAPSSVLGLMNLRGQVVTVLDLRARLELPAYDGAAAATIVCRSGDDVIGLLVDAVGDVVDATSEQFDPPPETLPPARRRVVRGTYQLPDRLLLELDVEHTVRLEPAG